MYSREYFSKARRSPTVGTLCPIAMTTKSLLNILTIVYILTLVLFYIDFQYGNDLEQKAYFIQHGHERGPKCIPSILGILQLLKIIFLPVISTLSLVLLTITKLNFKNIKFLDLPNSIFTLLIISIVFSGLFLLYDYSILRQLTKNLYVIYFT
jgi:hypothetical protein